MPVTYEPITSTTTGTEVGTINFTSIPGTYSDLRIIASVRATASNQYLYMQINGVGTANYSQVTMFANGTSFLQYRTTNEQYIFANYGPALTTNSDKRTLMIMDILNYANSSYNKTVMSKIANPVTTTSPNSATELSVGLFRSTSPITQITFTTANFGIGTTFTLYGITRA